MKFGYITETENGFELFIGIESANANAVCVGYFNTRAEARAYAIKRGVPEENIDI